MPEHYFIDGANICCIDGANVRCQEKPASIGILIRLVIELQKKGASFFCIFDASTPHKFQDKKHREAYEQFINKYPDYFREVPSGTRADEELLSNADQLETCIISNDRFREYQNQYPWLQSEEDSRLIKVSRVGKNLYIPQLGIYTPIHEDINTEMEEFIQELYKLWALAKKKYPVGSRIKGKVVSIKMIADVADVFVELETGIAGLVPSDEISWKKHQKKDPWQVVPINDVVEAVVLDDPKTHRISLSLKQIKANPWKVVAEKYPPGSIVTGVVQDLTDLGAFIELEEGINGLMHNSNIPRYIQLEKGEPVRAVLLDIDVEHERLSLGIEQLYPEPCKKTEFTLEEGKQVKGVVETITDYGVSIDLGGINGLLHITDIPWGRVNHLSELFKIGDEIEVVVLSYNKEEEKVALGLKQKSQDPWASAKEKYPVGSRVKGKIARITDYGAFVELETGIEGLVNISDISWTTRVKHPSEILKKGEQVQAVLLSIDVEHEWLSLGIKQLYPNPWEGIASRISVGDNVTTGKVVRLNDFGAFIELPNGLEGLLHVSEISQQPIKKPEDVLSIGQEITAKMIKVDEENRRIGLSIKAYEGN